MKASKIKKDLEKVVEVLEFCKTLPEELSGIENLTFTGTEYLDENINNLQNILKCFEPRQLEISMPEKGSHVLIETRCGDVLGAIYKDGNFEFQDPDCAAGRVPAEAVKYWYDKIEWNS